ncbi:hypothetical protein [Subtercola vilae]|uniref:DNA polymerase III subunit gamma/tau n=1 Tax=Subtercola vilae TaxID=2056433 RepID=A0A4T2BLB7_9MICO|nr:hypothetical protein [Subtercola vilae]TIH32295.1 hypothetical protein D4765_15765 [Subtercola vilae]
MARDPFDDALSWGDQNDPTYVEGEPSGIDDDELSEAEKSGTRSGPGEDPFISSTGAAVSGVGLQHESRKGPRWASRAVPDEKASAANAEAVASARATQVEAERDAAADDDLAAAEADGRQLSSAALITFGIIGGILLLYTVGWLVVFIRNPLAPTGLAEIVQNLQGVLAIAAPALWFIVTLLLAARRRVAVRLIWLILGVVVLVPWPFLTGK